MQATFLQDNENPKKFYIQPDKGNAISVQLREDGRIFFGGLGFGWGEKELRRKNVRPIDKEKMESILSGIE